MKLSNSFPSVVRRTFRHVAFAVIGTVIIGVAAEWANATGDDNIMGGGPSGTVAMSLGAAYAAYVFLAASLLVGPWTIFQKRSLPVSSYLRRDLGIWAAILALLHTIVGLQISPDISFWVFFFYPASENPTFPVRLDFFGIANYLGLIAALVLLFLLGLSSNLVLRKLTAKRWKQFQKWVYWAAIGTLIHSVMYLFMGQRSLGFVFLFVLITAIALAAQLWGYVTRRRANGLSSREGRLAE